MSAAQHGVKKEKNTLCRECHFSKRNTRKREDFSEGSLLREGGRGQARGEREREARVLP